MADEHSKRTTDLYFEAHVTLEPVDGERLEFLSELCGRYRFHVASLLMKNRDTGTLERSSNDSFTTGRSLELGELTVRMLALMSALHKSGFHIWRYKIEETLLDSRYDDAAYPLERSTLPEKERNPRPPV